MEPKFKIGDIVYSSIMKTTLLRVVAVHENYTHVEGNLFKSGHFYATVSVPNANMGLTASEENFEYARFEEDSP